MKGESPQIDDGTPSNGLRDSVVATAMKIAMSSFLARFIYDPVVKNLWKYKVISLKKHLLICMMLCITASNGIAGQNITVVDTNNGTVAVNNKSGN